MRMAEHSYERCLDGGPVKAERPAERLQHPAAAIGGEPRVYQASRKTFKLLVARLGQPCTRGQFELT